MFSRLEPPIPVKIVENGFGIPAGRGTTFGIIDYGFEHHIIWGVALDDNGEVWWVPNPFVRFQPNRSAGRPSG